MQYSVIKYKVQSVKNEKRAIVLSICAFVAQSSSRIERRYSENYLS